LPIQILNTQPKLWFSRIKFAEVVATCDCAEYLYLNDTETGEVHKFSINSSTGVITEIGTPWMSGFTNPSIMS